MGQAVGLLAVGVHVCRQVMKSTNKPVPSGNNYKKGVPGSGKGQARVIICANDYRKTAQPLSCTMDGRNMEKLLMACNVKDKTFLYDDQCTIENVTRVIKEVGARCEEDDYFVFYFSGHGVSVPDENGDEDDGLDEAFVFVDRYGRISRATCMLDDDFARIMTDALPKGLRVAILTDCCHSGTIADFENPAWDSFEAFSIAGCLDGQTSGDIGKGGIFTHSMLMALDALQRDSLEEYSVGMLFNGTIAFDERVFRSAQDITIQTNRGCAPDTIAWPLVPQSVYLSPLSQARYAGRSLGQALPPGTPGGAAAVLQSNPMIMQQLGVGPEVVALASANLGADVDIEDVVDDEVPGRQNCAVM